MVVNNLKTLFSVLPQTLTISTGDVIEFDNWHLMSDTPESVAYPHGRFMIVGGTLDRPLPESDAITTANAVDTIGFSSGTLDYQTEQWDIQTVNEVKGTLASTPDHIFVEDTDYEVVASGSTLLNTIRWLPGGDNPDDSTNFTVDYDHKVIQPRASLRRTTVARLTLHVKDLADGTSGATQYYPKTVLGDLMSQSLNRHLLLLRGIPQLTGDGIFTLGQPEFLGQIAPGADESTVRYSFNVPIRHHERAFVGSTSPTIVAMDPDLDAS